MALDLWNKLKSPPKEALKLIEAGRLKGKSDINPTWRYQALTNEFGPCGVGWKYLITRQWTEPGLDGQLMCFVNVDLYIKDGENWSAPIPGTGGDFLIKKEKEGLHHNDEAYAMALTDALGKSMKVLGMAADVYWRNAPETKHSNHVTQQPTQPADPGDYPVAMKNYTGPLKGMKQEQIEWIVNEYSGKDKGLKEAAKVYLNRLYDAELAKNFNNQQSA